MKLTLTLGALLLICAVVSIEAMPTEKPVSTTPKSAVTASKDLKDAIKKGREQSKAKRECQKACAANYDPVCAHDPANTTFKPRTFGNQCALDVHNCEIGTKLAVKSKGECPGADGVRLS